MAIQTKTYLKSRFKTGDKPTQQDFADLIDTMFAGLEWTVDELTGDGTVGPYTLTDTPLHEDDTATLVFIGGVIEPDRTKYSISSNTITFTYIIPNERPIVVVYLKGS